MGKRTAGCLRSRSSSCEYAAALAPSKMAPHTDNLGCKTDREANAYIRAAHVRGPPDWMRPCRPFLPEPSLHVNIEEDGRDCLSKYVSLAKLFVTDRSTLDAYHLQPAVQSIEHRLCVVPRNNSIRRRNFTYTHRRWLQ